MKRTLDRHIAYRKRAGEIGKDLRTLAQCKGADELEHLMRYGMSQECCDIVDKMLMALQTIGHSLVCGPVDHAEHNARELLRAGEIARAALPSAPDAEQTGE